MFNKISTATIVLSGLLFSGASQATEGSVEQLLGAMVSQAAYATQQEISYSVQKSVLTANNAISLESDAHLYATNVTITDLHDNDDMLVEEENDKAE